MSNERGRKKWDDAEIERELRIAVEKSGGRMPSATELRRLGLNALACKVSRTNGGFRGWASRLGLELKSSCTAFGQNWEEYAAGYLRTLRYEVERQTTKAPFDLLVNGHIKVNVKAATWHAYGPCKGYFFGIGTTWKTCHVLALVRVQQDTSPLPILWVPSEEAQQQTITLTERHRFNAYTSLSPLSRRPTS